MRLTLKPFGPFDGGVLDYLRGALEFFGPVKIADGSPLPPGAYDSKRRQYRAAPFLDASKEETGDRVLGLTAVDLYEPGLNFVFGLAAIQGRSAVISLARLAPDGTSRLHERALKEAVHELGHTLGLEHDPNPECVMHFSSSLADTDRKGPRFCRRCEPTAAFTLKRLGT